MIIGFGVLHPATYGIPGAPMWASLLSMSAQNITGHAGVIISVHER